MYTIHIKGSKKAVYMGYENSKDAYKEFEKLVNSLSEMRGTI